MRKSERSHTNRLGIKMKIPKHLKILIGIMCFGIAMQCFKIAGDLKNLSLDSCALNLLGIIISIGIIKGFFDRSRLAWYFAKGLTVVALIAVAAISVLFITVPVSGPINLVYSVISVTAVIESYALYVLFSKEVKNYFTSGSRETAQPNA